MTMNPRLIWASALCSMVLVAGCSSESQGDGKHSPAPSEAGLSPEAVAERYGYDEASAQMTPVFELVPNYNDERGTVALDLVMRDCMADVVELSVARPSEDPQYFEPRTHQARKSEELAAQWGYAAHYPALVLPEDPANTDAARAHREEVLATPEAQSTLLECQSRMKERLPQPPMDSMATIESAGWSAADVDPTVIESAKEWHACMEPAGVIDLPEDPMLMPSPSIREAGGIEMVPDSAPPPASQWEKDVAVADFRCRESSGWTQARWNARIQGELTAIGQDLQGFEAARLAFAEWGTKLDSVMAELG